MSAIRERERGTPQRVNCVYSDACPRCHNDGRVLEVRLEPDNDRSLVFDTPPRVRVFRTCRNSNCHHRYYVYKHVTDLPAEERRFPIYKRPLSLEQAQALLRIVDRYQRSGRWDAERVSHWRERIMAWPAGAVRRSDRPPDRMRIRSAS